MKNCTLCKEEKPLTEFWVVKGNKHRASCRSCDKLVRKPRIDELREWSDALKDKPCMDCGVKYPPYIMHWDHRPGTTKSASVGRLRSTGANKEKILAEVAKCDLVCSNCHMERTHGKRN